MEESVTTYSIPYHMESELMSLGLLSLTDFNSLESVCEDRYKTLSKGYFNDPRDGNGEVPF